MTRIYVTSQKFIFYKDFQRKLKHLIKKIGLNPDMFSSHSFRRCGATHAFRSKVPANLIQLHGDWKSDAYKNIYRYLWRIN